jgi:hypothetical protein
VGYAPAERADTLPLFLLYPYMFSVADTHTHTHTDSHNDNLGTLVPLHVVFVLVPASSKGRQAGRQADTLVR